MESHASQWGISADALTQKLTTAGCAAYFERADHDDIQDAFDDLRQGHLEPSSRLRRFYQEANPAMVTISPWVYEELRFIHVRNLVDVHDGLTWKRAGKPIENWRGHWIIIAMAGQDPYFVSASSPGLPVYTDTFGVGAWQPKLVASSLDKFLEICAIWTEAFTNTNIHPELVLYRERGDLDGLLRAERAWSLFRRKLKALDPIASVAGFWS